MKKSVKAVALNVILTGSLSGCFVLEQAVLGKQDSDAGTDTLDFTSTGDMGDSGAETSPSRDTEAADNTGTTDNASADTGMDSSSDTENNGTSGVDTSGTDGTSASTDTGIETSTGTSEGSSSTGEVQDPLAITEDFQQCVQINVLSVYALMQTSFTTDQGPPASFDAVYNGPGLGGGFPTSGYATVVFNAVGDVEGVPDVDFNPNGPSANAARTAVISCINQNWP